MLHAKVLDLHSNTSWAPVLPFHRPDGEESHKANHKPRTLGESNMDCLETPRPNEHFLNWNQNNMEYFQLPCLITISHHSCYSDFFPPSTRPSLNLHWICMVMPSVQQGLFMRLAMMHNNVMLFTFKTRVWHSVAAAVCKTLCFQHTVWLGFASWDYDNPFSILGTANVVVQPPN
jgi:hypothetical protein